MKNKVRGIESFRSELRMAEVLENKRKGYVVSLKIKVSKEEISVACDMAFSRLVKQAKVQGFRKGKVPRNIFEKQYGTSIIIQEALPNLVNDAYINAIDQIGLKVVDQPKDVDVPEYKDGEDLVFSCKVDVEPEAKVGKYKGLKLTQKPEEVTQDELDKQLQQIQEGYAEFHETESPSEDGSVVITHVKALIEEAPVEEWTRENVGVRIGAGYFGETFDKEVTGLSKGDKKTFSASFEEDYRTNAVAGKKVDFEIEVAEVRSKKYPELNDAFAEKSSNGQHKTLSSLTDSLREELSSKRKQENENSVNEQIIDKIIEDMKVEIPNGMVEREIDFALRQMANQLSQSKLSFDRYLEAIGKKPEDLREDYREGAERKVRSELALDVIAEKEKVEVTDDDLNDEISRWNMPELQTLEDVLAKNPGLDINNLRAAVRRQKTISFIRDNAKIKEEKD